MSDQLKITPQPVPRDPSIARQESTIEQIPQLSDTSKVIKSNAKDDYNQNRPDGHGDFNSHSIRAKTLRLFLSSETATEASKRLISADALGLAELNGPEAGKWAQFMSNFFLGPSELSAYLKDQLSNNSLFQGSFFDFLRGILQQHGDNASIANSLVDVLKALELYQNRQNTALLLMHNLNNLLPFVSAKNQSALMEAIKALEQTYSSKNGELSPQVQRIIMQVLTETASLNRDQSALRNMVMQAVHNLSRLEPSDQGTLQKTVDHFIATLQQYSKLSNEQKELMLHAFDKQLQSTSSVQSASDRIIASLDSALSPGNPLPLQLAASNILSALLLNHSVLLPLIYGFIPLQLDNTYLFSEMWAHVSDDEKEKESSSKEAKPAKKTTVFFTMESSAFGYLQGTLEIRRKKLSLALEGPELILGPLGGLQAYLAPIAAEYGYELTQTDIVKLEQPKHFIDVFGKQILKEASLNVQV